MSCDARCFVAEGFDRFVVVDFSAANAPKRGKDSIWVAVGGSRTTPRTHNIATRHQLLEFLTDVGQTGRTLMVFDVALGWPEGLASALGVGTTRADIARFLFQRIRDDERNESNRFEVAAEINRVLKAALFWGYPHNARRPAPPGLSARRLVPPPDLAPYGGTGSRLLERRVQGVLDSAARAIKSPFQLVGAGAVGSQSLLAQALVEHLRMNRRGDLAVWPFEEPTTSVVVAEEYFSRSVFSGEEGVVNDEAQVLGVLRELLGASNEMDRYFDLSWRTLSPRERRHVVNEEGWLLLVE